MRKKRILIALMEIGYGHKGPALAIQDYILSNHPGRFEVEVVDIPRHLSCNIFDLFYKRLWNGVLLKYPNFSRVGYHFIDNRLLSQGLEKILTINLRRKLLKFLLEKKPDLVLGTHHCCVHMMTLFKSRLGIPVIGMDTDPFDAHWLWIHPDVDYYIVFSEQAKGKMAERGIAEPKIRIFNYPIHNKFCRRRNSTEEMRKRLGLDPNKTTVLMTDGAEGVGRMTKYITSIIQSRLDVQLVGIAGKNQRLFSQLKEITLEKEHPTKLIVYSLVTNLNELVQASDFVFGKAGANTTFESLIMQRPIIHNSYTPDNEKGTMEYVVGENLGRYCPDEEKFLALLKSIIDDRKIIADMKENIRKKNIVSGTPDISEF